MSSIKYLGIPSYENVLTHCVDLLRVDSTAGLDVDAFGVLADAQ